MKKKINKKEGIFFWITGVSGSGKSTFAKKIINNIRTNFGPSIILHGDDFRKFFKLNGYSRKDRLQVGKSYINFLKLIIHQKINVVFTVVGLLDELRALNKKTFKNYVEIYIQSDLKKIIKLERKKIYKNKLKNIVGIDTKAEFPKNPHIILKNNFNKSADIMASQLNAKITRYLLQI
jgi:adenylylsulfate kinase